MPTKYGDFMAYGYVNKLNGQHHVALVKGDTADKLNVKRTHLEDALTGFTNERESVWQDLVKRLISIGDINLL